MGRQHEYHCIYSKGVKIVGLCETMKQLEVAINWVRLATAKLPVYLASRLVTRIHVQRRFICRQQEWQ